MKQVHAFGVGQVESICTQEALVLQTHIVDDVELPVVVRARKDVVVGSVGFP